MDANWRPVQGSNPPAGVVPNTSVAAEVVPITSVAAGVVPITSVAAGGDWRPLLSPESRSRIVNKIQETLNKNLRVLAPEGLNELHKIAVRFEEKIYSIATDQTDYLRKISLKMLSMDTNTRHASGNPQVIPNQNNPGQGSKNRASWTDSQTEMLVVTMKEYADAPQYHRQNGWTKEGWNFMAARLNEQFTGANFTTKQVQYRAQRLKREYAIVKSILDRSGFSWDPEKKVLTSIDEKWDELSQEQQKWRFKEFPHYDDLHGIYEGKTIQGKQCKRTTDVLELNYNSLPFVPEQTFTEPVQRASRPNSPGPTLEAPGLGDGDYARDRDENYKLPEAPPVKKAMHSEGSDEGKPKEGMDVAIGNIVPVIKEELETKDVKTK